jgi:hypothetical protein
MSTNELRKSDDIVFKPLSYIRKFMCVINRNDWQKQKEDKIKKKYKNKLIAC